MLQVFEISREMCNYKRADLVVRSTKPALTNNDRMRIKMAIPTQARVREYFNYDAETGNLLVSRRPDTEFSKARLSSHLKRLGTVAGHIEKQGYRVVVVDWKPYKAHQIIWLHVYGEWVEYPKFEIDHINGDRADNRISNLRKVTKSQNQRNAGQRVNNTSGVHGVNWKPKYNDIPGDGLWVARIWNGPRHVYLGGFKTLHEAQIARKAAERVLGFTGTNRPPSEQAKKRAQMGRYLKPAR